MITPTIPDVAAADRYERLNRATEILAGDEALMSEKWDRSTT